MHLNFIFKSAIIVVGILGKLMVEFYSKSNMTLPIGMNYNNSDTGISAVKTYRAIATSSNPMTYMPEETHTTDFAQAIYGNGPYSLLRPNSASDVLCLNLDLIA